jgi:membrane-bound lytic murein transglycosylase D
MNKFFKRLTQTSLLFAMMFSFSDEGRAQIINEQPVISPSDYDPIAATLDSLVNLHYIQRLSQSGSSPATDFKPHEVPSYTADIYTTRIQKIQTPIPLCYNRQVREYIDMYALKKRGLTERVMGLSSFYFPMYEQVLDQQGLPLEFKYLSIVESALNPMAVSRVGATGLWQFMLATGRMYDLKVNSFIDERRDPYKATMAACQYFKDMYAIYNDWLLVIASYNCGAGNVNRAIARSGGKKTFWEICNYLPKETRGYVPAFIAVTYLMNYAAEHNLTAVPPVLTYFEADTIMVDQKVQLRDVADVLNVPYDLVAYLNPIYKRGVIPDGDEPMALCLPVNKITPFLANLSNIYKPEDVSASLTVAEPEENSVLIKKYHQVRKGDQLSSIANRYHCTVNDLKRWNRMKSTRLSIGQKVTVYVKNKAVSKQVLAKNEKPAKKDKSRLSATTAKAGEKLVYHTVEEGDTLWKIALRYEGMTVEQIKQINQLHSNDLKIGTKLKIIVNG